MPDGRLVRFDRRAEFIALLQRDRVQRGQTDEEGRVMHEQEHVAARRGGESF